MKKKLLAGILTLALCSTNILPQTVFAEEFTSGNPEEVSEEETPGIFTNEEQEEAGETDEELSVFSSEEVPEFNDTPDEAMVAAENEGIDLANVSGGIYTISSAGNYTFTCSKETENRIVVNGTISEPINICLNNVKIKTRYGPALQIATNVQATVTIFLKGTNDLRATNQESASLQKDNKAPLIIKTNDLDITAAGSLNVINNGKGAGIGGGSGGNGENITINGGSVNATTGYGAGIGGGFGGNGKNITINGGSVDVSSPEGAGIGGGSGGNGENITINNGGSVNATTGYGAGIGGGGHGGNGENITINNGGSVTAKSADGAGIGGGSGGNGENITINGGSVNANSSYGHGAGIGGGGIGSGNVGGVGSDIIINGGSVNASAYAGAGIGGGSGGIGSGNVGGIGRGITINGGSVNAKSSGYGAGIGGGSGGIGSGNVGGVGSDITIYGGSVTASSRYGAGIGGGSGGYGGSGNVGGNGENITINGGSVNAKSADSAGIGGGSGRNIIINGGSVKADFGSGSPKPKNRQGADVYCCTIENKNSDEVIIDGNSTSWEPKNHLAVDPKDTNLYAWLTGKTHTISVGEKKQIYYFDNNKFKLITNNDFTLSPEYLTYNGKAQAPLTCNIENIRNKIKLSYYKDGVEQTNGAVNVGTYTVKANIEGNSFTDSSWTFTIHPASVAPGYTTQTQILVPWSCKKISDITKPFRDDWQWNQDVNLDQKLQVGEPITATAVYIGNDKGNYKKESITYTITRKECEHKNTVGRYYSSPSCTSSGYSGDTYCNDCERTIYYGSTIPAYGHDYDAGVITTEPTTETDGIITYTCKRCKHQDTKNLGKLGDGEPYIEGSFQKKGWDTINDLIKTSKEKDTISIIMNGARTLPASVLSGIKGKDISLNLDMENGFIWKINGTSITAETPADTDLSVTNTAEYIPAALYSLISTNQNDFGFHLGRSGAFDFPVVLSVKADASCAGLMANLFWYDVENGVLQCIQTVTVGGAFEDSIPYADFTLSKGQDYFIAFGTESLDGRVIHTDGSITDENGAYLRPADTEISSHSIDRNKLTVRLAKGCAGAQGYDFVISKKSDMLQTGKFSKTISSTGKPQASFRYLAKGTWYVAARSWVLDAQGNKVYGSWTKVKKIKITVVTPQQPKIRDITVKGNTVTVTYTKCKNATGYEILLGTKYKTSAGEKYPIKKYVKRTEGKNTVTVTFTNVKKGTWYVTVRSWNRTSKNKSRVYSPYSTMKKFAV